MIVNESNNICIDTDVLDDVVDNIYDILIDNPTIQFLNKIGIGIDIKYEIDPTLWVNIDIE